MKNINTVKPLGDAAIVTADNYGDDEDLREMCEIRYSQELTAYIPEGELFDMAEEFFEALRTKYIPNISKK